MMKLHDSYLCPDCDEIFTIIGGPSIYNRYPICPTCGNRSNLSLSRVLNRKEDKTNEKYHANIGGGSDIRNDTVSEHNNVQSSLSNYVSANFEESPATSGDQIRVGRSGEGSNQCGGGGIKTDGIIWRIHSCINVYRKFFQKERRIKQKLSRFDANSSKDSLSRCKLSYRVQNLFGKA